MDQQKQATLFRKAHEHKTLVLPNVWDAASARVIEQSGAEAIATTSAGISWSRGVKDGEALTREEMLHTIKEIVAVTSLPVTADIESGYGNRLPGDVYETTSAVIEAGVVGINIEDTPGYENNTILQTGEQAKRIAQARKAAQTAGKDLFINARIDIYLADIGHADTKVESTLERAAAYLEAGADGIFIPGLSDLVTIKTFAESIQAPLNVMAGPGSATVPTLQEAGVARVSLGPALAMSALALTKKMSQEVLSTGTYKSFYTDLSFQELNSSFEHNG